MSDGGRALYDKLAAPFAADELEWRVAQSGAKNGKPWAKVLVYIDARAARRRLNDVAGPANWRVEYGQGPANGVVATLSIRIDGEWIAKQDGANTTDIEATKGGISDAFKRACAVWGIGEYLYGAGESWADFKENGSQSSKIEGAYHKWDPPKLKAPALAPLAVPPSLPSGVTRGPDPELVARRIALEDLLHHPQFTDDERASMMGAATSIRKTDAAIKRVQELTQERESAIADMERERELLGERDMFEQRVAE